MASNTRALALTALFSALTAAGAFLKIPLGHSAITLPFLFTAMAGLLLGRRWGAVSQAVYLAVGLAGVPVFTAGGGIGYVAQPTFGFLLGLVPCAWVIGYLSRKGGACRTVLSCLAGLAVLYAVGLPYMALILRVYLHKSMDLSTVLWAGMLPFLPGDAVKIAVAATICPILRRRLCIFDELRQQ